MKQLIILFAFLVGGCSQTTSTLDRISQLSKDDACYLRIKKLAEETPARMSASTNNLKAIEFLKTEMESFGIQTRLDSVTVPNWKQGETRVHILRGTERLELRSAPLGLSIGTDGKELKLRVVEFTNKQDFENSPSLEGCAVFFNEKMDTTESGYSKVGWQRMYGASMAAKKGAAAVVSRSLTPTSDEYSRTGTLRYEDGVKRIPSIALSTQDADLLSEEISKNPNLEILLSSTSSFDGDAIGFNLIGEIKGSTQPENIILITAHIDSWFNSQGAQDNATGCAQAVEILRIFSKIGIKPRNTIRVMIYQDEEISMSGMKKYIELYGNENHLYNLELDSGAEEPIGFTLFDSEKHYNDITSKIAPSLQVELSQIPIEEASFWPLSAAKNTPVYFYMAQRKSYFSIHHSQVDNIDSINPVNIQKSSNIIASFVYLSDL